MLGPGAKHCYAVLVWYTFVLLVRQALQASGISFRICLPLCRRPGGFSSFRTLVSLAFGREDMLHEHSAPAVISNSVKRVWLQYSFQEQ